MRVQVCMLGCSDSVYLVGLIPVQFAKMNNDTNLSTLVYGIQGLLHPMPRQCVISYWELLTFLKDNSLLLGITHMYV